MLHDSVKVRDTGLVCVGEPDCVEYAFPIGADSKLGIRESVETQDQMHLSPKWFGGGQGELKAATSQRWDFKEDGRCSEVQLWWPPGCSGKSCLDAADQE